MTKVAVASRSFSRHPVLREELRAVYPDATFNDNGLSLKGDDLIAYLRGHEKAIIALEPIDGTILDLLPELRVVAKYGVGFDKIDLHAMIARGVELGWCGGVNRRSVAELVIGFAISLLRRIPQTGAEVRGGVWQQTVGRQLSHRTVGVIGCGYVGKDLIRILRQGFGCRVLVNDLADVSAFCADVGAAQVDLDALLGAADVVSLHLPLDPSTEMLMNAERLSSMRNDAILINTARGGLVDEEALCARLMNNQIAGVAFDVFKIEPPDNAAMLAHPNFMVTPHIGGSAEEAILAMGRAAISGLDAHRLPAPGVFPPGRW